MDCLPNTHHRRRQMAVRIVMDIGCIAAVAIALLAIKLGVEPYHRGFFCDDESIKHPVLSDTITVAVAVVVGILIPVLMILIVEIVLSRDNLTLCMVSKRSLKTSWIASAYAYIVVFVFGLSVSQFLTEVGKVSIGRLRPHFLTLCAPDFSTLDCTKGYITEDVCTSTDTDRLKEARLPLFFEYGTNRVANPYEYSSNRLCVRWSGSSKNGHIAETDTYAKAHFPADLEDTWPRHVDNTKSEMENNCNSTFQSLRNRRYCGKVKGDGFTIQDKGTGQPLTPSDGVICTSVSQYANDGQALCASSPRFDHLIGLDNNSTFSWIYFGCKHS